MEGVRALCWAVPAVHSATQTQGTLGFPLPAQTFHSFRPFWHTEDLILFEVSPAAGAAPCAGVSLGNTGMQIAAILTSRSRVL